MNSIEQWEKAVQTFTTLRDNGTEIIIRKTAFPNPMTLEAIKDIEMRYWDIQEKRDLFYKEKWQQAYRGIEEAGGEAHCKVTHNYNGSGDPWWLWKISGEGRTRGIHYDWVETPTNPINLTLGQKFYEVEQYGYKTVGVRYNKFRTVLRRAIEQYLYQIPPTKEITLRFEINSRNYWYVSNYNQSGVLVWAKIAWPEDSTMEIVV